MGSVDSLSPVKKLLQPELETRVPIDEQVRVVVFFNPVELAEPHRVDQALV